MKLSKFGEKFSSDTGIQTLMDDIGGALASDQPKIMMGGGNPAVIEPVQDELRLRMQTLVDSPQAWNRFFGSYDPPKGNQTFLTNLCGLLKKQLGWAITERNIALTNGSQSAFFMLFNFFAGDFDSASQSPTNSAFNDPVRRQIQLPLAPEYIGYADAGIHHDMFMAAAPNIQVLDNRQFKYTINFDQLSIGNSIGAICVSRPTNPTGNVITDNELEALDAQAKAQDIPLIIDGAYGFPFPGLIFTQATPFWNDNTVVCLSLSKLGLPSARTGIVIANEAIVQAISRANAIINLTNGSLGPALIDDMVKSGNIIALSQSIIRPHYEAALAFAQKKLHEYMSEAIPWLMHKPEGTMFIWLWFKGLPITSQALYERLKNKGVIVVSGHHFFPGIQHRWQHRHECIRINYAAQDMQTTDQGLKLIAQEVALVYQGC